MNDAIINNGLFISLILSFLRSLIISDLLWQFLSVKSIVNKDGFIGLLYTRKNPKVDKNRNGMSWKKQNYLKKWKTMKKDKIMRGAKDKCVTKMFASM